MCSLLEDSQKIQFQFTPLREGLHGGKSNGKILCYFNSRPCERGFYIGQYTDYEEPISIHAPARGASSIASICFDSPLFQFTPLREGLLKHADFVSVDIISIHAPARGASNVLLNVYG